MDEIVFTFPDIASAAQTLRSLQQTVARIRAQHAGLQVSRGGGADGLEELSDAVSAFAAALEDEMRDGAEWLALASSEFKIADDASASAVSKVGEN